MPPTVAFSDLCSVLPLADGKLGATRRGKKQNITNKHVTQGTARLSKIQKELVTARPLQVLKQHLKQHTCSVCQVLSSRQHSKPAEDLVYTGALHHTQLARTPARTRIARTRKRHGPDVAEPNHVMQIYGASSRVRVHEAQNPPSVCFAVVQSHSLRSTQETTK